MRRVGSKVGTTSRGARERLEVRLVPYDTVVGSPDASATVTLGVAATMDRFDGAEQEKSFRAEATDGDVEFSTTDESVAVVDVSGLVTRVGGGGNVRVVVENNKGIKAVSLPGHVHNSPASTAYAFKEWAAGSLARHCTDEFYAALPLVYDAAKVPMFDSYQYNVGGIRNPLNWAAVAGWDLSCISVDRPNSCLIGSDILLQVEHYPDTGTTAFVGMDGSIHTRDIVSGVYMGLPWKTGTVVPGYEAHQSDFRIAKLDSPLPASVKPALLPPVGGEVYLNDLIVRGTNFNGLEDVYPNAFIPVMHSNQWKTAQVLDFWEVNFVENSNTMGLRWPPQAHQGQTPEDVRRWDHFRQVISGDSGSNFFLPPLPGGDRMTVIGGFTGPVQGTNMFSTSLKSDTPDLTFIEEMVEAVTELGCVGVIEHADWGGFSS